MKRATATATASKKGAVRYVFLEFATVWNGSLELNGVLAFEVAFVVSADVLALYLSITPY